MMRKIKLAPFNIRSMIVYQDLDRAMILRVCDQQPGAERKQCRSRGQVLLIVGYAA